MKKINKEFEQLITEIKKYNPSADIKKIRLAWEFATNAHNGQKRLTGEDYIDHPLKVASIIVHWHLDTTTIVAALLHDTVEDTDVTLEDIAREFGEQTALLVKGVTKVTGVRLRGSTDDVFIESLRKMILVMAKDLRVVFIKLADRIHNMRTMHVLPKAKQIKNAQESLEIYAPLAERLGIREAKGILENLSFPVIYPNEYEEVKKVSAEYFVDAQKTLDKIIANIESGLKATKVRHADVYGRKKNLYSLWRKLERKGIEWNFDKINDIIAIRVLVDDVVDCYKALGVIHSLYKPAPHIGLSDFIAQPKPNGYQSIHTRVFGNGGIIEIQIRTYLMHEAAEHGLAAHWAYSEAKFKKGVSDKLIKSGQVSTKGEKLEWVRQLLQWQKEVVDSQEFIERVKFDALGHRIFAFSPKGDVYDLPLGATPIDYAFAVHSDLGRYIKAAKVNGKMVSLNHPVDSGDIIEIIKSKNERALNRDWLRFAVTNVAKREITKELRKT